MRSAIESEPLDIDEVVNDVGLRSAAMWELIARRDSEGGELEIPHTIVQFWDSDEIPADVRGCLRSWDTLTSLGFTRHLFNVRSARNFIGHHFAKRHLRAFERCSHPAMQADYFRYCFIYRMGGIYVDADDEYMGGDLDSGLRGGVLKLHPLCYRVSSDTMEDPFAQAGDDHDLIFYVNNNPLMAPANHPLVGAALKQATDRLLSADDSRDIQMMTGPGNLTEALVRHANALALSDEPLDFQILRNWESIARSKWPLDYRQGDRNWRRWATAGDAP